MVISSIISFFIQRANKETVLEEDVGGTKEKPVEDPRVKTLKLATLKNLKRLTSDSTTANRRQRK